MVESNKQVVRIDVVSDFACPWCFIGCVRLEQALAQRPEQPVEVAFRPYLLSADVPAGGTDLREDLQNKYGVPAKEMFARVEQVARESGIPLDFEVVRRRLPTWRAHQLAQLSLALGQATHLALVRDLFEAYFLRGEDYSDLEVLRAIAQRHGVSEEALASLDSPETKAAIEAEASEASRAGVRGVPFFVFDGRLALSGAQPVEELLRVLDEVSARRG